ncbi:hypothetical protein SPFM12_00046 [Salmonella phage SPFM12]|nr:hypothetical protein SPFM12_00046 [Salmonella phage SPFM12]
MAGELGRGQATTFMYKIYRSLVDVVTPDVVIHLINKFGLVIVDEAGFFFNKFSYDCNYLPEGWKHATGAGISGYENEVVEKFHEKAAGNSWLTVHDMSAKFHGSVLYLVHNESLREFRTIRYGAGRQKGVTTHTVIELDSDEARSCGFLPHIALSQMSITRIDYRAVVKELSKGLDGWLY